MAKSAVIERPAPTPEVVSGEAPNGKNYRPGDKCDQQRGGKPCLGTFSVTATFVQDDGRRIRYLQCNTCHLPRPQHKQIIPPQFGSRRRRA